ncbi:hypothetical protein N7536_002912 [Penicillium majusculum]|uniref:Uncharacterized protein n=1 Tax=Penicillium solitum TaxID=60172 RepID=A0A1V6RD01_9EURO|nr:uncharacterized protein PENSOL_c007G10535 [Penicillium solitum]KAJ5699899.1 hypothetical protein N7536_002912 [Penicillium majusculum]OQD99062.1 hypothetical protein PENSOL_c007G10535 [Penicillium solitum]
MGRSLIGDKTSEEVDLEQSGDINALQRYRFVLHWNKYRTRPPSFSRKLLFVEEDLREVVQEEISIKEGLDALNVKYWLLEQIWWHHRSCLEDGFQLRGFQLWRSHPKWYMHRVLVEDCAGRQGCCARECGCCLNPPIRKGAGNDNESWVGELIRLASKKSPQTMASIMLTVVGGMLLYQFGRQLLSLFCWAVRQEISRRRWGGQQEKGGQHNGKLTFTSFHKHTYTVPSLIAKSGLGNDDSVIVEILRLAAEKGVDTALKIGSVVLLFHFLRDLFTFFFRWGRVEVIRAREFAAATD